MAVENIINAKVDLADGVHLNRLGMLFAENDQQAHTFNISIFRNGEAVTVSDTATISGYFIRPDNATITMAGTSSSNVVTVTLPANCYTIVGHFSFIVRVTSSAVGSNTTVFWSDGFITQTITGTVLDPQNIIPSLDDLYAELDAMAEATQAAEDAAEMVTDAIIPDLSDVTTNTLEYGQPASVTIDTDDVGTPHNPKVTINIPRGAPGRDGRGAVDTVDNIQPVGGNVTLPVFQGTDGSTAGSAGKVPAPDSTDAGKFLGADGDWESVPTYQGADSSSAGVPGLVPSAPSADRLKFLRGDGSWVSVNGGGGGVNYALVTVTIPLKYSGADVWSGYGTIYSETVNSYYRAVSVDAPLVEYAEGIFIPLYISDEIKDVEVSITSMGDIQIVTTEMPTGTVTIRGIVLPAAETTINVTDWTILFEESL